MWRSLSIFIFAISWLTSASEEVMKLYKVEMIRKLPSGGYRLFSRKINLKTGKREAAVQHEREIQFFKRR